jgi:hypothetical protein
MGYIDELELISKYSAPVLINAILKAFDVSSCHTENLPKKAKKVVAFLSDEWFWFSCSIIHVTGIHIFKHLMKFLESRSGVVAHDLYFEIEMIQNLIVEMKDNINTTFADVLQTYTNVRRKIIVAHLNAVAMELQQRFGDWQKLPLVWAALSSTYIKDAKRLAKSLYRQLKINFKQLNEFIDWQPLSNLLRQSEAMKELKDFSKEDSKFEDFPLLVAFHKRYFLFCAHNVVCERAIACIYRYKKEAPASESFRVSTVCRSRFNKTIIPINKQEYYWKNGIQVESLWKLKDITKSVTSLEIIPQKGKLKKFKLICKDVEELVENFGHSLTYLADQNLISENEFIILQQQSESTTLKKAVQLKKQKNNQQSTQISKKKKNTRSESYALQQIIESPFVTRTRR